MRKYKFKHVEIDCCKKCPLGRFKEDNYFEQKIECQLLGVSLDYDKALNEKLAYCPLEKIKESE